MTQADAQTTMVGTMPVPEKDRLDEARLTDWMRENVAGFEVRGYHHAFTSTP